MTIEIKILNKEFYTADNLPTYATQGSAAIDLVCTKTITLYPQERIVIPTGLAIWVGSANNDYVGLIVPRSGLGTQGLILANTIGVIDADYQDELKVSVWNTSKGLISINSGDRFAQLLFSAILKLRWYVVDEFSSKTTRTGGFGSTGD